MNPKKLPQTMKHHHDDSAIVNPKPWRCLYSWHETTEQGGGAPLWHIFIWLPWRWQTDRQRTCVPWPVLPYPCHVPRQFVRTCEYISVLLSFLASLAMSPLYHPDLATNLKWLLSTQNSRLSSMYLNGKSWVWSMNPECRVLSIGREFASQPGHTKDHHKNGTDCLPAWHTMR